MDKVRKEMQKHAQASWAEFKADEKKHLKAFADQKKKRQSLTIRNKTRNKRKDK